MKTTRTSVAGATQSAPSKATEQPRAPARVSTGITAIAQDLPDGVAVGAPAKSAPAGTVHSRAQKLSKDSDWVAFSGAPDKLATLIASEIEAAYAFTDSVKGAFTFFGGARIDAKDPFFAEGEVWGEALALVNASNHEPLAVARAAASGLFSAEAVAAASGVVYGVAVGAHGADAVARELAAIGGASSPQAMSVALARLQARTASPADAQLLGTVSRTGAGPGMMEAVPLGYLDAKAKLLQLMPELAEAASSMTTQGSAIKVPYEDAATPYVQQLEEFTHFLPRRLGLTERCSGFVVFPGGLGTLNEMFEVLRNGRATVLHSAPFWTDMIATLTAQWQQRGLVDPALLEMLAIVDSPAEGLPHLLSHAKASHLEHSISAAELSGDVQRGLATLSKMPTAVTFIGGSRLTSDDPEVAVARELASRLTKSGIHARAGGAGAVLDAVSDGVRSADPSRAVQALLLDDGDHDTSKAADKADVCEVVHSTAAHKVLMYENTDAIVALPGGVGTFDEVFEVACLMQTGKLKKRPLILVGESFWQPFLDAMTASMLDGDRQTIHPEDPQLFTVVDDAASAARLVRQHRAAREEESP